MPAGRPLPFDPVAEAHRQWARRWDAADVMAAVTAIMRAQQLLIQRIDRLLAPLDLTFARYEALVLLAFSRSGALPLGKMGQRLMVHPASVTNAVNRLEGQGLVRRVPNPDDRRGTLAEITPAGRRRVDEATAVLVGERFGAGDFSAADARRLTELVARLRVAVGDLTEETAGRPAGTSTSK